MDVAMTGGSRNRDKITDYGLRERFGFQFQCTRLRIEYVHLRHLEVLAYVLMAISTKQLSKKNMHQTRLFKPFHSSEKSNIIGGIMYRLNSPPRFMEYFIETKQSWIHNGGLQHQTSSSHVHDFLLCAQSCSFTPTICKPTRAYSNSATLVDNILTNKIGVKFTRINII